MGKGLSVMGNLNIMRAHVFDVEDILELVNSCATSNLVLPRGPKYLYEDIRDFVVIEAQTEMGVPEIVACGSLHVLWRDTAEIRSLVTHPEFRGRGLRSNIVRYLIEYAKQIGIKEIIALRSIEEFFTQLGFKPKRRAPVQDMG